MARSGAAGPAAIGLAADRLAGEPWVEVPARARVSAEIPLAGRAEAGPGQATAVPAAAPAARTVEQATVIVSLEGLLARSWAGWSLLVLSLLMASFLVVSLLARRDLRCEVKSCLWSSARRSAITRDAGRPGAGGAGGRAGGGWGGGGGSAAACGRAAGQGDETTMGNRHARWVLSATHIARNGG